MPNHRKSDLSKRLQGTYRRDRAEPPHVELPLVAEVPAPPESLANYFAKSEWIRLAPILCEHKMLTTPSLGSFAVLCSLYGAIVQATSVGVLPKAAVLNAYRALANDFGCTPIAQRRIRPQPEQPPENPFSRFSQKARLASIKARALAAE